MNENYEQNLRKLEEWWQERPDTCWEPGRGLRILREEARSRFRTRINVDEKDDRYLVSAVVPGVDIDKLSVSVGLNDVIIEQLSGEFCRKLALDKDLDATAATAKLSNGILQICLPKQGTTAAGRHKVKIGEA